MLSNKKKRCVRQKKEPCPNLKRAIVSLTKGVEKSLIKFS